VTPKTVPGAPATVTASAGPPGSGEAVIDWTNAAPYGSQVTLYTVTPSPACSCGNLTTGGTTLTTTVTGLVSGTTYVFAVAATNSVGTGPAGDSSSLSGGPTPPDAPSGVVASGGPGATAGNGEVDLSWNVPFDNGATVTSYVVTPSPACSLCHGLTPGAPSTVVTGLTPGTAYSFKVSATNSAGTTYVALGGSNTNATIATDATNAYYNLSAVVYYSPLAPVPAAQPAPEQPPRAPARAPRPVAAVVFSVAGGARWPLARGSMTVRMVGDDDAKRASQHG